MFSNPIRILGILDPLKGPAGPYDLRKDTSHLLLLEFYRRGHAVFIADPSGLRARGRQVSINARPAKVLPKEPYFQLSRPRLLPARDFHLILARKDPPVDASYLKMARLLGRVAPSTWVCNRPSSLMRWNEKLVILQFPRWIPPTLVSSSTAAIRRFAVKVGGHVILKSLTSFGGRGITLTDAGSADFMKTVDTATAGGKKKIMVQAFLDKVREGDKRIFLIDGKPIGALTRTPLPGEYLANPDLGASLHRTRLTPKERRLCASLSPFLKRHGIFFAGADVIGEKLTEINITSPGMLWEWNGVDKAHHEREIVDLFEKRLKKL